MSPKSPHKSAQQIEQSGTTASVRRGLADANAGLTRPARQAIKALASELGLKLVRRLK